MGGQQINCPLCCDKSFDSKHALVEHITNVNNNIFCPICNSKCNSLQGLTEHLTVYNCQPPQIAPARNYVIYEEEMNVNTIANTENSTETQDLDLKSLSTEVNTPEAQYLTDETYESQDETGDEMRYVEVLRKSRSKTGLQTSDIKFLEEDGHNRYVIVTPNEALNGSNSILTKQNVDGTISLTSVKDLKVEIDPLLESEPVSEPKQVELYSCNTCGVSFTSVIEHIQNYHNDQEVVLEDGDGEATIGEKQTERRVITDTGNIVVEPLNYKPDESEEEPKESNVVLDKHGHANTKRSSRRKKTSETVTNATTDKAKGDFHKVIKKQVEMKTGLTFKMYNCLSCNITVTNLNEFEGHPCKAFKHPCTRCPVGFDTSRSLQAHMKVHKEKPDGSPDVPFSYVCEVCSTVFKSNKSLKLHKRMHDPIKARPIELPVANGCGKISKGELYVCPICDKEIPLEYRTVHENSHKSSNKMNCSICNKKFTSLEFMEMHMSIHNMDKVPASKEDKSLPYKCLFCSRRFARPHEKVKHERIHTGEKPHSCEICGKSFRVLYCLTLHMRTHTGARPYGCTHCGKRFKAHSVYSHHLQTHSDVRAYKCPFCPKAFKTSVQLSGHKNSHTKPFSCQHCNRPFASLYAVRVHTETHNRQNNLKFSCQMCGASYARAFALKDHVKQVHQKDIDTMENIVENTNSQDGSDDWVMTETVTDSDELPSLNNELQQSITDLEMTTNGLL